MIRRRRRSVGVLSIVLILVSACAAYAHNTTLTHTVVSVSNSASTTVLVANGRRNYIKLQNEAGNHIWCKFGTTAVASQGFRVASSTGEVTFDSAIPVGQLNCIAATGATNLLVTEGVQ